MKRISFSPPDISEAEINAVVETLRSGWITTGPRTKEFEALLATHCRTKKAVCLQSATSAMEMTLRLMGIGPGDEVITSAYTYTASASVVTHVGATLVLVDTEPDGFHLNINQVKEKINEKTKAIIPVDIAGVLCDYEALTAVLEEKSALFSPNTPLQEAIGRVAIISDAAHAFGAMRNGKVAGELADFTCFSFHAVKNLTTAEGGAVTWKLPAIVEDEEIYRMYMVLSLHGQDKDALAKSKAGSWEYDMVAPYYKCNMTDILAGFGLVQLRRYPDLLKRRKDMVELYDRILLPEGFESLPHYGLNYQSTGHLYLLRIPGIDENQRNHIIQEMAEAGIATNVHYKPLPMFTAYKRLGFDISDYPNAYDLYHNEITLPLHTILTNEDIEYVCDKLISAIKTVRNIVNKG